MDISEFKIAQVGVIGHYEYIRKNNSGLDVRLCAIAPGGEGEDVSVIRGEEIGRNAKIYSDWREMIENEKPDVLIVNSYMNLNAKISIFALERGIHVFCEKPVATTFADLGALENAYKAANKVKKTCFCGMFGILDNDAFVDADEICKSGKIGEIRLVNAQKSYRLGNREPFYSSREMLGGMIPWVAIHAIDWIYHICKLDFNAVTASHSAVGNGGNGELEATALMLLESANGAVASVSADYLRPSSAKTHDDDRIRIVGTRGIIEIRDGEFTSIPEGICAEVHGKKSIFSEFMHEIAGEGECRVSARETIDVTRIALTARESADCGRKIGISL